MINRQLENWWPGCLERVELALAYTPASRKHPRQQWGTWDTRVFSFWAGMELGAAFVSL